MELPKPGWELKPLVMGGTGKFLWGSSILVLFPFVIEGLTPWVEGGGIRFAVWPWINGCFKFVGVPYCIWLMPPTGVVAGGFVNGGGLKLLGGLAGFIPGWLCSCVFCGGTADLGIGCGGVKFGGLVIWFGMYPFKTIRRRKV